MLLRFLLLQSNNQQTIEHATFRYKNLNLFYLNALVVRQHLLTVKQQSTN
uniref:Uncharacterized protein n=1 Tax=Arundo donax TaxID=35708 RepID=A0A0A8ZNV7_ARUDO